MKYISIVIIFSLLGCSSSNVRKSEPRKVSAPTLQDFVEKESETLNEEDFKDVSYRYSSEYDYADSQLSSFSFLSTESLSKLSYDDLKDLSNISDPLTKILRLCLIRNFKKAFKGIDAVYKYYMKIPTYWNVLGSCHAQQGNSDLAKIYFDKSISLKKNYAPGLNNLAVLYFEKGHVKKSVQILKSIIKSSPQLHTPRYNLAYVYLNYGLYKEARKHLDRISEGNNSDYSFNYLMAISYMYEGNYSQAQSYFSKIPLAYIRKFDIGFNQSLNFLALGQMDKGSKLFNGLSPVTKSQKRLFLNYSKLFQGGMR